MKHAKGPWKFGGRASKEVYVPETGRHICTVHFAALQAMTNINFNEVSLVNAELIALAPTAPHDCDPDCPGAVNKKRLEMFEEMVAAITDALANCEQCRGEKGSRRCARCQTFEKLIAKVKGE